MSVSTGVLRELHRIHRQIAILKERLDKGPRLLRAREGAVQSLTQSCEQRKQALLKTRILADDKQLQLRQREDRIKDLRIKLNTCGSNREYQTLTEQIAADLQANSVLSDEILELLERMEQEQSALAGNETELEQAQRELGQLRAKVEQEQQGLSSELERVQAELTQAEVSLPADIKVEYFRNTKARGEDALAPVEGEICSGCYHLLTAQTMNLLALGQLVFCKSCGALLYLPADDRVGGSES